MSTQKSPVRIGADFVAGLLSYLGVTARVQATESSDGSIVIRLDGPAPALSQNADLQAAIAQLAGQAVSQATEGRARVVLDLAGENDGREDFLGDLASEVADLVAATGKRAVIEGLGSPERRIVHTALMDHGQVNTHSEGGESNRYLLVEPA